jgi:anti-sigma-K factor RskA
VSADISPVDYLLGELGPAERAEAERRLREDPAFRREVDRLRPVVVRLEALPAEGWAPLAPPPLRMPGEEEAPAPARPRRAWLRPVATAVAVCALLGVGVAVGLLIDSGGSGETDGPALALRPLSRPSSAGGTARVVGRDADTLDLQVHGLAPTDGRDFYEIWLMDTAQHLVALGTFQVPSSGTATVRVPLPAKPSAYRYLDVSREPADGNPAHSGDSVLRGDTL